MAKKSIFETVMMYLHKDEATALATLIEMKESNKAESVNVVISSGLDDFDDWAALLASITLTDLGLLNPLSYVVGLQGSYDRALVTKGVLQQFGLDIPVAVGSDKTARPAEEIRSLVIADPKFKAMPHEIIHDQVGHIENRLDQDDVPDKSVKFLGLASFTDFDLFIRAYPSLFDRKVNEVILMSGIMQDSEIHDIDASNVRLNDKGFVMPNWIATNNRFDKGATSRIFENVQRSNVLSITTRQLSYATSLDVKVVDTLSVLGLNSPIAEFASRLAGHLLQKLWQDIIDAKIPRDKPWFFETFFNDSKDPFEGRNLSDAHLKLEPMIRIVEKLIPYDVLPLIYALDPVISADLFAPLEARQTGNSKTNILGLSKQNTGISEIPSIDLSSLMAALIKWPILKKMYNEGKL